MSKRILVTPDIHGEIFWKEPVLKYIEQVDKIIFLGDYLDPYPEEGKEYPPQGLFDNLILGYTKHNQRRCIVKNW